MPNNTAPSINQKERDRILTSALLKAAGILDLTQMDLGQIIGESEATMSRTFQGSRHIRERSKEGELAVMLIRAFRSLDAIVGGKETAIRHWFHTSNRHMGERVPAELVKSVEGLSYVCTYLDAMRGKI
jgi:uncharacterized protein (DUF2384 family)